MGAPTDLKYSNDHEWVRVEADQATVGVSDYAQGQLGGLVFIELPSVGDALIAGEAFGEVESVKSVSELIAPVSGEIVEVNTALEGAPETINNDPYGAGWIVKVALSEPAQLDELLDADAYEQHIS
ncbi:MAG: glycine cleavage system protein GcvH [Actinomycetia bacterium]|nr:glycine cleavage system protein GcvH [Actinomycetes bacterium]